MNDTMLIILSMILVFLFDLVTIAARSGLRNLNLAQLIQILDDIGEQHDRVFTLIQKTSRSYAGLHFFQGVCHFILVGLLVYFTWFNQLVQPRMLAIILFLLISLLILLAEWVVERRVAKDPEAWVNRLDFYIQAISIIFYPVISISTWLSGEDASPSDTASLVTEEDLKLMVEAGQQEGVLEQEEGQMIFSIFQLGDTLTREIMVPRIEMLAIDGSTPLPEALDTFLESGYSRLPVYVGRVDNVVGILYAKDMLQVLRDGNGGEVDIHSLIREPYFVPEAKKVDELLAEMQHRRVHMAIVVDEYGGVAGVVTLEDIIEEILGEIQDEYDVEDLPFQVLDDGSFLFRGRIDLDDFNQITGCQLPPDEADTLSGFIYGRLGHVPETGEGIELDGLELRVEQVSNRRIRSVRARLVTDEGALS
jgi:CBS domain containing-hemolysin-like protein